MQWDQTGLIPDLCNRVPTVSNPNTVLGRLRLATCSLKTCLRATDMKDPSISDGDGRMKGEVSGGGRGGGVYNFEH